MLSFRYVCEAFVDQGRMIGNDHVGRACSKDATHVFDTGHLLCEECLEMIYDGSGRISLRSQPLGIDGQEKQIMHLFEQRQKFVF